MSDFYHFSSKWNSFSVVAVELKAAASLIDSGGQRILKPNPTDRVTGRSFIIEILVGEIVHTHTSQYIHTYCIVLTPRSRRTDPRGG